MSELLDAAAFGTTAVLAVFFGRRVLLLFAASRPRQAEHAFDGELPSVTLLVPARNEAAAMDATLLALSRVQYPPDRLFTILIDDASDDDTRDRFARWADGRPRTLVLPLPSRSGKAAALNGGLASAPESELVAICDGDLQPRPDSLRLLAEAFQNDEVAAAAPFLSPLNAHDRGVSSYAAVESWVHQLVTSEGKDRLGLNPATNGASMYRRSSIKQLGGFPAVASGDDVSTTAALTREGWRTRFIRGAIVDNAVADDRKTYWHQHIRWSRNLFSSVGSGESVGGTRSPITRRIELLMQSAGYVDRIALAVVIAFVAVGKLPLWVPLTYVGVLAAQIVFAVISAGEGRRMPRFLFWTTAFYAVDATASAVSVAMHVFRRRRSWPAVPRHRTG